MGCHVVCWDINRKVGEDSSLTINRCCCFAFLLTHSDHVSKHKPQNVGHKLRQNHFILSVLFLLRDNIWARACKSTLMRREWTGSYLMWWEPAQRAATALSLAGHTNGTGSAHSPTEYPKKQNRISCSGSCCCCKCAGTKHSSFLFFLGFLSLQKLCWTNEHPLQLFPFNS